MLLGTRKDAAWPHFLNCEVALLPLPTVWNRNWTSKSYRFTDLSADNGLFMNVSHYQVIIFLSRREKKQGESQEMKRERNPPDSLRKSVNLTSCWFRRHFINFVQHFLWHILTYLGLLVNSAHVIHEVISFLM